MLGRLEVPVHDRKKSPGFARADQVDNADLQPVQILHRVPQAQLQPVKVSGGVIPATLEATEATLRHVDHTCLPAREVTPDAIVCPVLKSLEAPVVEVDQAPLNTYLITRCLGYQPQIDSRNVCVLAVDQGQA